jgi:hypothetical protein
MGRLAWSARLFYPGALAVLGLGFAVVPLARGEVFFFWDNARMHVPQAVALHDALRAGHIPEWSFTGAAGYPTVGEGNGSLFHPLRLLLAWLLPGPAGFMVEMGLWLALTGITTYLFVRVIGAGPLASFVAGLANMFGGFTIVTIKNIAHMRSLWILPLVLLCAERFVTDSRKTLWILLGGVAFGMQFLTGNPHMAVVTAVASGLYVLFRTWQQAWVSDERLRAAVWKVGAAPLVWAPAALIGMAIGAVQVIPQTLHTAESTRAGGMSFEFAMQLSASLRYLAQILLPYAFEQGYQFADLERDFNETSFRGFYMGMVPAVLAAVAVLRTRRPGSSVPALLALAITGTALALGQLTPLYPALWTLPGFGSLRFPFRFLAIPATCVACLAGMGFAELFEARDRRAIRSIINWLPPLAVFGAAVAAAVALAVERPAWLNLVPDLGSGFALSLLLLGAACALVLAVSFTSGRVRQAVCVVLVGFMALDALWFGSRSGYAPTMKIADVLAPPPAARFLLQDTEMFRVMALETWERAGPRNETIFSFLHVHTSGLWGIESADPYESLMLRRYFMVHEGLHWELLNRPESAPRLRRYIGALNVKYVLAPAALDLEGWEPVYQATRVRIWSNPLWLPRAFLVSRVVPEHIEERDEWVDLARKRQGRYADMVVDWSTRVADSQIVDNIFHSEIDYGTTAIVAGPPFPQLGEVDLTAAVSLLPAGVDEMRFHVTTRTPGFLVIASTYYPGWSATVDGVATPIYRTNWVMSGVFVPAGGGEVVLRFSTPGLKAGAVLSGGAVLLVCAGLVALRRRGNPVEGQPESESDADGQRSRT